MSDQLRHLVDATPREELPRLIGELAEAQALAFVRMTAPPPQPEAPPVIVGDGRWLSFREALALLGDGWSRRKLRDRTRGLAFVRVRSSHEWAFREAPFLRWIERGCQ